MYYLTVNIQNWILRAYTESEIERLQESRAGGDRVVSLTVQNFIVLIYIFFMIRMHNDIQKCIKA